MAFAYAIMGKILKNPPEKNFPEQQGTKEMWGTFVSSAGGTGGVIKTGGDQVVFFSAFDDAVPDVQIELDTPNPGEITITTTADSSGRWKADVQKRKW